MEFEDKLGGYAITDQDNWKECQVERVKAYMAEQGEHPSVTFHRERREAFENELYEVLDEFGVDGLIMRVAEALDALDVEVPFL